MVITNAGMNIYWHQYYRTSCHGRHVEVNWLTHSMTVGFLRDLSIFTNTWTNILESLTLARHSLFTFARRGHNAVIFNFVGLCKSSVNAKQRTVTSLIVIAHAEQFAPVKPVSCHVSHTTNFRHWLVNEMKRPTHNVFQYSVSKSAFTSIPKYISIHNMLMKTV